jgi:vitamin B12 transporter
MCGNWLRNSLLTLILTSVSLSVLWAQGADPQAPTDTTLIAANRGGESAASEGLYRLPSQQVVVTANRIEETIREVVSNITVIDLESIEKSTANDMANLLQQQGFYVVDQGTQDLVQIRGMNQPSMGIELGSPVLVLLNGRRIGGNNVALMGLANVERVEIVRGPSAVQYGPSAMGGVINIITKRGKEGVSGTMEIGLGSFKSNKERLAVSGAGKNFDFSLGAVFQGSGDYNVNTGEQWLHTARNRSTNLNADFGYTVEQHRLGVNFNFYDQPEAESSTFRQPGSYSQYAMRNHNLSFNYAGATADKKFDWSADYGFGKDKGEGKGMPGATWNSDTYVDIQTLGAGAGYNGRLFDVDLGFDYMKYDVEGTYQGTSTYKDAAGYVAAKARLLDDKIIVSAGGRYDDYKLSGSAAAANSSDSNFTYSLGLAYLPQEWLKLRADYAEGFRMPTPAQLGGSTSGNYIYRPSPDLKPESSSTWEIGADVNWEYIGAGVTYFHTDWNDKIISESVGGNEWRYINIDAALLTGVELTFGMDIGRAMKYDFELRPYVSLSHMISRENKDHSGGSASVEVLGTDVMLNIPATTFVYGLDFNDKSHDFGANINAAYTSSSVTRDYRPNWGEHGYGAIINGPKGTVVNASLRKGLYAFGDSGNFELRVEINNLFNRNNEFYLQYPGPGRSYYTGLRYNF